MNEAVRELETGHGEAPPTSLTERAYSELEEMIVTLQLAPDRRDGSSCPEVARFV